MLILLLSAGLAGCVVERLDQPGQVEEPASGRKAEVRTLLTSGRAEEALEVLDAIDRPDGEALWLRSRAALQLGNVDAASDALDRSREAGFGEDPMRIEPSPFVGADRCAECHSEILLSQQSSHHARSLRDGSDSDAVSMTEGTISDPDDPAVSHHVRREDGSLVVETEVDDLRLRAVVDWLIGSGRHAVTPVGTDAKGQPRELRISHYAGKIGWDLTTGHPEYPGSPDEFLGRPLGADELKQCLNCHATNHEDVAAGSGPTLADGGIGCERCHGPGGNHLLAVAAGLPDPAIVRPRAASAEQVVGLCGDCHRPLDSDPTMTASPMLITSDEPSFVRFQAATLVRSACYRESPPSSKFDCVSCHDPHRDVETDPRSYEAVCLSCHAGPSETPVGLTTPVEIAIEPASQIVCPVNARQGCIDCHMPRRPSTMRHTTFTDHHIRVQQDMPMGPDGREAE